MKRITLLLTIFISINVYDIKAQTAMLQILNETTDNMVAYVDLSGTGCVTLGPAMEFFISPGENTCPLPITATNVNMVRIYPASCTTVVAANITLGSPCSPCPIGGFASSGTFSDIPCGGGNVYFATWSRCLNPGGGYPFQGNLIRIID